MSDFDDLRDELKAEFVVAGFWIPIRVTSLNSPPVVTHTNAAYRRPDVLRVNGSQSSEHQIEYVADDLPDLAEGHLVDLLDADGNPISGQSFRVREPSFVLDDISADESGYFRRALLTKL